MSLLDLLMLSDNLGKVATGFFCWPLDASDLKGWPQTLQHKADTCLLRCVSRKVAACACRQHVQTVHHYVSLHLPGS